jgi:osmotically-inducible protein OsmY
MAQPAALLTPTTCEPTGEELHAGQATRRVPTPSAEDLRPDEAVERALRATGYRPLRGIRVTVEGRLVILRGRVPSYYLKQVAQTTAMAVPGVVQVRNDLEVGPPS